MEIILFRHGPAAERDPHRWPDDAERPLTKEGIRETHEAARGLARLVDSVARVISSPALRARDTARAVHEALEVAAPVAFWDELAPERSAAEALSRLRESADADPSVLVGHEPVLSELVGLALSGDAVSAVHLSKAGAARLSFPGPVVPAGGRLDWLLTRKQLALLGRVR
jgi:phosphohistidine phosphatase